MRKGGKGSVHYNRAFDAVSNELTSMALKSFASVLVLGVVLACTSQSLAQDKAPEHPSGWTDKRAVVSRHEMVAAANPLAVEAGDRILRAGGSAVDAAIAVQLVLGFVEPQSSGLGGGAFLLTHDAKTRKLIAYDGRETAPAAATPERIGNPTPRRDPTKGAARQRITG
jgi:gamma-glutamyltranspeptidase/glutathione hydrolase